MGIYYCERCGEITQDPPEKPDEEILCSTCRVNFIDPDTGEATPIPRPLIPPPPDNLNENPIDPVDDPTEFNLSSMLEEGGGLDFFSHDTVVASHEPHKRGDTSLLKLREPQVTEEIPLPPDAGLWRNTEPQKEKNNPQAPATAKPSQTPAPPKVQPKLGAKLMSVEKPASTVHLKGMAIPLPSSGSTTTIE
ncbi:MAG: hypothetical protein V3T77_09250, partial [Planctomycetota bacterium]